MCCCRHDRRPYVLLTSWCSPLGYEGFSEFDCQLPGNSVRASFRAYLHSTCAILVSLVLAHLPSCHLPWPTTRSMWHHTCQNQDSVPRDQIDNRFSQPQPAFNKLFTRTYVTYVTYVTSYYELRISLSTYQNLYMHSRMRQCSPGTYLKKTRATVCVAKTLTVLRCWWRGWRGRRGRCLARRARQLWVITHTSSQ
jgi:hypothetical protein